MQAKLCAFSAAITLTALTGRAQEGSAPPSLNLHLQCAGEGSFTRAHQGAAFGSYSASASDNRGGFANMQGSTSVSATTFDEARINDDVLVDITGDQGRIRIPRRMLPPVHSGDEEGWRSISPLTVNDREIRGHFSMNFINKPSVSIDRVTGRIELAGHRDFGFRGDCRAYDPSTERKF
jgi:hypothetical protein